MENLCNPVKNSFDEIFLILFPRSKRQPILGGFFYEVFASGRDIKIESVNKVIGKDWADFYKFQGIANTLVNYPSGNLEMLSNHPEHLGHEWDMLNKNNFAQKLTSWLLSILNSKVNPVNAQPLCETDLEKLQEQVNIIQPAFNELISKDYIHSSAEAPTYIPQ